MIRENEALREPLEIKIINAGELKSENVISIKRDENSGKMMGRRVYLCAVAPRRCQLVAI